MKCVCVCSASIDKKKNPNSLLTREFKWILREDPSNAAKIIRVRRGFKVRPTWQESNCLLVICQAMVCYFFKRSSTRTQTHWGDGGPSGLPSPIVGGIHIARGPFPPTQDCTQTGWAMGSVICLLFYLHLRAEATTLMVLFFGWEHPRDRSLICPRKCSVSAIRTPKSLAPNWTRGKLRVGKF